MHVPRKYWAPTIPKIQNGLVGRNRRTRPNIWLWNETKCKNLNNSKEITLMAKTYLEILQTKMQLMTSQNFENKLWVLSHNKKENIKIHIVWCIRSFCRYSTKQQLASFYKLSITNKINTEIIFIFTHSRNNRNWKYCGHYNILFIWPKRNSLKNDWLEWR